MATATINDIVNIAVGAGVCADTPADRERYKAVVRRQPGTVQAAASGKRRPGSAAVRPNGTATAASGTPSATAQPTEYPKNWMKRGMGVAAGLRTGRKARAGTAQPGNRRSGVRVTEGRD